MSEHGDETGMVPERSCLEALPQSSLVWKPCRRSLIKRSSPGSSHGWSSNPATPRRQITPIASPSSPDLPSHASCPASFHVVSPSSPVSDPSSFAHSPDYEHLGMSEEMAEIEDCARMINWYIEKLQKHDAAAHKHPEDVNRRIHRAEALLELGRIGDAYDEFRRAYKLDPGNPELHHGMCQFHIRIGILDSAELHKDRCEPMYRGYLSTQIQKVKDHLLMATSARDNGLTIISLRAANTSRDAGADLSPSILALKAEMLLNMDLHDQAKIAISKAVKLESEQPFLMKFLGMEVEAYIYAVLAQIEMALGNFRKAVAEADKAYSIDNSNAEISAIRNNVRMASAFLNKGNNHYMKGSYLEAYKEYEAGLQFAKSNVTLLSYMAACNLRLEKWGQCIKICNDVLRIRPDHEKALKRRAHSYAQLDKWVESVSDSKAAVMVDPEDATLAKELLNARSKLEELLIKDVSHIKIGPVITETTTAEQLAEAISVPGWADLPEEILARIFTKLGPIENGDFVRFRAVCTAWHSLNEPLPKTAWLLQCEDGPYIKIKIKPQQTFRFYNIGTRQVGAVPAPHEKPNRMYYGPGHGYLLVVCSEEHPYLLNPLTGNTTPLPPLKRNWTIHSLVCSGSGPKVDWCIVACQTVDGVGSWMCAVYHQDGNNWTYVKIDTCSADCSVCVVNQLLFASDTQCMTGVYDAISGAKLHEVAPPADELNEIFYCVSCHIIESSGDILRVSMYIYDTGFDDGTDVANGMTTFKLYKLCSEEGQGGRIYFWVSITDIGGQILFLDRMSGFSLKAPPGLDGNFIYYVVTGGAHPSLYNIVTHKEEVLDCPYPQSTWFIPSLG